MNRRKITDVTRKEIFTLFSEGYIEHSFSLLGSTEERIVYAYNGDISEVLFLGALYQLEKMPSSDHRFNNARDDIYQHTVNNDDWKLGWVFYDSRFNLKECEDEELLKFICRIFHPTVRNENACWKGFLDRIQNLLKPDGYELYIAEFISGRAVYKWRELTEYEIRSNRFVPFSERFKGCSIQIQSISHNKRNALVQLMRRLEERLYFTDDTGWNYYKDSCVAVMDSIKEFYTPKAYNDKDEYVEENDFDKFVMHTSPKSVFDVIELFPHFNAPNFENEVNNILTDIGYKLIDGKMMAVQTQINVFLVQPIKKAFSSEYISEQMRIMLDSQKENPTESIGKSKELIESCCKTILEDNTVVIDKKWDITRLVDETVKLLKITPKVISQNIATIRNAYGTGHGKSASYKGLEERHAKLAVGSSLTLVNFLWDAHLRMLKTNNSTIV